MADNSRHAGIEKLHEAFGAAFQRALDPVERQGRALQREFFLCGSACVAPANNSQTAEEVVRVVFCADQTKHSSSRYHLPPPPTPPTTPPSPPSLQQNCVAQCARRMQEFQSACSGAEQAVQGRVGRCHQIAGEAAEAAPEHERLDVYLSRLKPCFKEEEGKIDGLFAAARAVLEGGNKGAAPKKGWF